MRINEASDLFYECVSVKASEHEFNSNSALSGKGKHPNYKSLDSYFQVDGQSMASEGHHSNLPKLDFRAWNYKARNTISFSVSKIFSIYLTTSVDSTNEQNTMRRVI